MFQAGDLLVYGSTGVCRVLSIDRRQERVGSIRQERLYYQLKPIYQGGLIYTPVDNDKVSMRPIISRQEAEDLISEIPTLHPAACRASTTQALTQQYQASLRQHDCRSLVELAMSIHAKRRQAESQNRRLGMVDERYLKQAEQLLFGELAAALEIPYEAVDRVAYLVSHHHTYTDIDGIDYQILIEADYIVNASESGYSPENS